MSSIEIQTTQNVIILYELASVRDRLIAMLIDVMVVIAGYILFFFLVLQSGILDESSMAGIVLGFIPIVLFVGYHLFFELLSNGQSLGKKAMRIRVVRLDGKELGLSDLLLRAVFHLIDTLLSIGVFGVLMMTTTEKRQRLGDLAANTTVIRNRSNNSVELEKVLKINKLENYEPMYPAVRQFADQDMLIIKRLLIRHRKYPNQAHQEALAAAAVKISGLLQLETIPEDHRDFLETVLKDFVVLTR